MMVVSCTFSVAVVTFFSLGCAFSSTLFLTSIYIFDHGCTTVITDPEDPQFDLEKLVAKWEKEHQ